MTGANRAKSARLNLKMQLDNGEQFNIVTGDEGLYPFLAMLGGIMQLDDTGNPDDGKTLLLSQNYGDLVFRKEGYCYSLNLPKSWKIGKRPHKSQTVRIILTLLAQALAQICQLHNCLLVHAALIAKDSRGVVLAAPGGTGKTTASGRMPPPWHVLSDDACLLAPLPGDGYAAYPWPTWSRFISGKSEECWNSRHGVPLEGIYFVERSAWIWKEPIGQAAIAGALVQSNQQVINTHPLALAGLTQQVWLAGFETVCKVAKSVPGYRLGLNLEDPFWFLAETKSRN